MTAEQQNLCRQLVITPLRGVTHISREEFLRQFPSAVEHGKLAFGMLEDAYEAQNAEDLQCALIVGFGFGFAPAHLNTLRRLVEADWHYSHEDVVTALETWPTPDTVDALFAATQWIPKSLEYDDSRALAVKAIWALGKIPGGEAGRKLEVLARSDNVILQQAATDQLVRRRQSI
jgi:hypothetical protein